MSCLIKKLFIKRLSTSLAKREIFEKEFESELKSSNIVVHRSIDGEIVAYSIDFDSEYSDHSFDVSVMFRFAKMNSGLEYEIVSEILDFDPKKEPGLEKLFTAPILIFKVFSDDYRDSGSIKVIKNL